jgi:IMP and pyridine-specific 5'-nucleotidase
VEKYTMRISGLLAYFREQGVTPEQCRSFYLFGGECNYLLRLSGSFELEPVKERGPGGWVTATRHVGESPANWSEAEVGGLLDAAHASLSESLEDLQLAARVIRKRRAVGLIPGPGEAMSREALDECVLRVQARLHEHSAASSLPYCAFNGGRDVWVDVGNKRVGVSILQTFLGLEPPECLHVGDQFLNTGEGRGERGSEAAYQGGGSMMTYKTCRRPTIMRVAGSATSAMRKPQTGERVRNDEA